MRRIALVLLAALTLASVVPAQESQSHTGQLVLSNSLSFASTALMAQSIKYGVRACIGEGEHFQVQGYKPRGPYDHRLPRDMFQPRTYAIGLSADAAALGLSLLFHKKHHHLLAVLAPMMNASVQSSIAGFNYSAGCF